MCRWEQFDVSEPESHFHYIVALVQIIPFLHRIQQLVVVSKMYIIVLDSLRMGSAFFIVINTISGAYGMPHIQIQGQWNAVGELCIDV